jgi:ParB family chromosome partitioning protein
MSCIIADQDFLIYVADNIGAVEAKFLSDVANAHKPLSLYERGKEMQHKMESGEAADQKSLAKIFQCSEALVSGALKAASLPLELLQAYPNVSELGRPTIVKLHKQYQDLSSEAQAALLEKCRTKESFSWQRDRDNDQSVARFTKDVSAQIEAWVDELAPKTDSPQEKVVLAQGRIQYTRRGSSLSVNLKKVDDDAVQSILAFIESKMD